MKYIKSIKEGNKILLKFNNILLGYCYMEVDGLYVFVFNTDINGFWSDYVLREIADILTELNKEWYQQLSKLKNNG